MGWRYEGGGGILAWRTPMKTPNEAGKPGLDGVAAFLQSWDPSGKGKAERHAPKVFALLKSGATARQVAEVLRSLHGHDSQSPAAGDNRTAVRLVSWYRRTR